jgi:hypothetical protein
MLLIGFVGINMEHGSYQGYQLQRIHFAFHQTEVEQIP